MKKKNDIAVKKIYCSKKIPALLHRRTSKHKGYFYCLNCLNSFGTENKPKSYEKVC